MLVSDTGVSVGHKLKPVNLWLTLEVTARSCFLANFCWGARFAKCKRWQNFSEQMTRPPQVSSFQLFLSELSNCVRACHMHLQYLHGPMWQQSCLKGVSSVCFCACLGLTQETKYEDNSVNTFHWLTELVRLIMLYFFQYFSSMPTEYFVNYEDVLSTNQAPTVSSSIISSKMELCFTEL